MSLCIEMRLPVTALLGDLGTASAMSKLSKRWLNCCGDANGRKGRVGRKHPGPGGGSRSSIRIGAWFVNVSLLITMPRFISFSH